MTLTRLALCALAITTLFILPTTALAGGGKGDKPFHGLVSAVDTKANTITITKKKTGEATTFKAADAKITVNGAPAKLADILVGMHASVMVGATPDTATAIDASTQKTKKSSIAAAPPATASTATGGSGAAQ
jgi:hypothetical protein